MPIILITGPARSGKSEWAEQLAHRSSGQPNSQGNPQSRPQVTYIATAQANPDDPEWCDRIEKHKERRPEHWLCKEVPVELAEAIWQSDLTHTLLIDSLGTWLANVVELGDDDWNAMQGQLLQALSHTEATVILVAEETGWGVVPAYQVGRVFRDRLGALSRYVGEIATDVYLVTSGYAINLSSLGMPVSKREFNVAHPNH